MKRKEVGPQPIPSDLAIAEAKEQAKRDIRTQLKMINLLSLAGLDRTFGVDPAGRVKHLGRQKPAKIPLPGKSGRWRRRAG